MFGAYSGFSMWSTCSQPASPLSRVRPRHIRGLRRSSINDGRVHKTSPTCHIRTKDPAQTNTHHSQMCWIFLHSSAVVIYIYVYSGEQLTDFSDFVFRAAPSICNYNKQESMINQKCFSYCFFFFFSLKYLYSFCCCSRLKWRTLSLWPCRSKNEINASIPALNIRGWTVHINGLLSVSMQRITMDKNSLDCLQNVIASNQKTFILIFSIHDFVVVVFFKIQVEKEKNI